MSKCKTSPLHGLLLFVIEIARVPTRRWHTISKGMVDVPVASDVAGNAGIHILLGGFPPSLGASLYQDGHPLQVRMERPVMEEGTPSRNLQPVSTAETEGGVVPGPNTHGGTGGGAPFRTGRAGLHSRVVSNVE